MEYAMNTPNVYRITGSFLFPVPKHEAELHKSA